MPSRAAPRPPDATSPPWRAELGNRMADRLVIKVVSVSAFVALFFQGYFHTLRQPVNPVTTMPLTPLDGWISFAPWAIVPYFSLWFYVGIAPGLLLRWRDLIVYGLWAAALCGGGLAIFHLWPTEVPTRAPETAGLPGFALLAGVDGAGNACPSLHVATAVFTATWVERLLRTMGAPAVLR
ncbi:MAG: PA-phosphatase, partial [Rubrivivax sp.]